LEAGGDSSWAGVGRGMILHLKLVLGWYFIYTMMWQSANNIYTTFS